MKPGKNKDVIDSFNVAIEGIIESIRSERNMKFHFFCAIIVAILVIFLGIGRIELMILLLSISLVIVMELINTAIECCVDLASPKYHILAKKAKDVAAGAVFLSAINAVVVGYLIFHTRLSKEFQTIFYFLKNSYANTMIFIIILLLSVVIFLKVLFKRGTPLRGGIPSGHSALGGALFVGIFHLTDDMRIFYLSLFLLILVLQSRVEGKIHTVFETIVGAILGMVMTHIFLTLLSL